jgi:hypothetical protein
VNTFVKLLFRDPGFDTTVLITKLASLVSQFKSFPRHKINQPKTCFGFIILCAGFLSGLELFEIFSKEHENIVLWNEKLKEILNEDHSKTVLKITY